MAAYQVTRRADGMWSAWFFGNLLPGTYRTEREALEAIIEAAKQTQQGVEDSLREDEDAAPPAAPDTEG